MKNKTTREKFFAPDWPKPGPIDLHVHDLPHASSTTEWWYMHSHIRAKGGRNLSLFASFFRHVISYDKKTKKPDYAHSVIWAISDLDNKKYHTVSLVDMRAPQLGLKRLKKGELVKDPFIRRAAIEMLSKGVMPYPDELLTKDPVISHRQLYLNYDGNIFRKLPDGSYQLRLLHKELQLGADIRFKPMKPPTRHGDDGVVRGVSAEDMFYYFIPRCKVTGTVRLKKEKLEIASATGWYDHEFGCHARKDEGAKDEAKKDVSWNWIAIQLNNGCEVTAYDLVDLKTGEDCGSFVILIDEKGRRHHSNIFKLKQVGELWTSTRTFNEYPTRWILEAPEFDLKVTAEAVFPNQEFATVISKPAFWEGRMNITGTLKGKKVSGPGYIERHGFVNSNDMKEFLKAVSKATLKSVQHIIPLSFGQEKFEELISRKGNKHLTRGVDKKKYIEKLIKPIRDITDRKGKSWRSYATVACCDAVGGDSQVAIDWLALPELMHVGSLMVDDVQDKSTIRRGGPAAHILHGEAIAINSGTAAYFLGQYCIYNVEKSYEEKVQIYNWYFESMRASHSGQALDICGLDYMMPDALKNDRTARLLQKRVLAIHRLKSAAPASYLARIGVLLGRGTQEQIDAMGNYFEALGIAFQIIDDTLNLKGFKDNLKTKAEDITAGKITYPIAKAMAVMPKADRRRLWEIVSARTNDTALIGEAISLLDKYQVIEMCEREAKNILERAWRKVDPLLRDSMVKLNLRAFSWFVLERTY
ncbi:MAG: polyprenyl synthetase family protein [Chitinophagales bacterium]|nr:polyprenyl synthetase family protein [Chitinophagales bacterium]